MATAQHPRLLLLVRRNLALPTHMALCSLAARIHTLCVPHAFMCLLMHVVVAASVSLAWSVSFTSATEDSDPDLPVRR